MAKSYLTEAFEELNLLDKGEFDFDKKGAEELAKFKEDDAFEDFETVIDPNAHSEDELQDSYIGMGILGCDVCHSMIYKAPEEIIIDEESHMANVGEPCPYCYETDGFKIIGKVAPFEEVSVEVTDKTDDEEKPEPTVKVDGKDVPVDEAPEKEEEALTAEQKYPVQSPIHENYEEEEDEDGDDPVLYYVYVLNDYKNDPLNADQLDAFDSERDAISFAQDNPRADLCVVIQEATGDGSYNEEQFMKTYGYNSGDIIWIKDESNDVKIEEAKVNEGLSNREKLLRAFPQLNFDRPVTECADSDKLEESDKPAAIAIEDYQKWVDYDMEHYGKISERTNELIKKAGFQIVKDDHGDYEVVAGKYEAMQESLNEGIFKSALNFTINIRSDDEYLDKFGEKFVKSLSGEVIEISKSKIKFNIKRTDIESLKTVQGLEKFIENIKVRFGRYAAEYNKTVSGGDTITSAILEITIGVDASLFKKGKTRANNLEYRTLYKCELTAPNYSGGWSNNKSSTWKTQDEDSRVEEISKLLRSVFESLNEGMEDISITTDDQVIKVKATPRADKETIEPMTEPELEKAQEEATPIDATADEEEVDVELDEIDSESFDELGESYLKKVYDNVNSFKTTDASLVENKLMLEGVIEFASGKKAKTKFLFEGKETTKKGKIKFIGENANLSKNKRAFTLTGTANKGNLICEQLNYNYLAKDEKGASKRLYGTVRKSR